MVVSTEIQNENSKIYYHKLGDKQENDKLIYAMQRNIPVLNIQWIYDSVYKKLC